MGVKQIAERLRALANENYMSWAFVPGTDGLAEHEALQKAADLLERMAWVPVSERLPATGYVIARYEGVYEFLVVLFWRDGRGHAHFGDPNEPDGKGSQPATHWMPLPDPPEQGE